MKKYIVLVVSISLFLVGCQSGDSTGHSNPNTFYFGEDLVFLEDEFITIDLENSSAIVKQKHAALSAILTDEEVLGDIAAMTTTTANILSQLGIQVTAAPESESLDTLLTKRQYVLGSSQSIDKTKVLNIGSAISPNVETIIELDPKLALYSDAMPHGEYMDILRDSGVNLQPLGQSDYLDMFVLLDVIGSIYNHENEHINTLFKEMTDTLKSVQELLYAQAGQVQPTVAILQVAGDTVLANNDETVLGKIVSALGVNNVFKNNGNGEVNTEEILAANPDYIIYFTHGNAQHSLDQFHKTLYDEDSVYRELDAVKNMQAFPVASEDFIFAASVDLDVVKVISYLAKGFYE